MPLQTHSRKLQEKNTEILKICADTQAPKFIKETLLQIKLYSDPQTVIVGDFNTPLSLTDGRPTDREMKDLIDLRNQVDLTDNRAFHPNKIIYLLLCTS